MQTFILLTRLVSEEVNPTFTIQRKEVDIKEKVEVYCPEVEWVSDFAVLGPWDYLDIFNAPDIYTAMKVSAIVRYYGGAHTEIWPATAWSRFKGSLRDLAQILESD
ncbi:MAG: GYD domain-containing protein [Pseudohongiellaceae bacterium]